ncbi:MAG: ABC transporter ATP-binding protein [Candidatus Bipolaricaulota bacterium]
MTPVSVEELGKHFPAKEGQVRAVDGLSFSVRSGEIFGLLGPNGAGKTTTLRILAGLISPSSGRAMIYGYDVASHPEEVRARLGFLATETGLYERLSPWETLSFFARIFGLSMREGTERAEALLRRLELWPLRNRRVGTLSVGERQKLSFARCLVHDPPLLILDEPTAGLDVFVARTAVDLISELARAGKTVVVSTHDMHLAERLCERVGIIHRGKLATVGGPQELRDELGGEDLADVFFRAVEREGLSLEGTNGVR